ncbi:beta-lactamase superfamily domain-containing protein [Chaetomium sp. MPI-SDFR-AT-0129]|nr:beta-lactamase superfamily domain-containing protein [Chaetomium sp. MPI-SDFR-AT-0129]
MFPLSNTVRAPSTVEPPAHHVLYLPDSEQQHNLTAQSADVTQHETDIAGFRNPWPSWHKHTRAELLQSLQWGDLNDGCVELAASHIPDSPTPPKPDEKHRPRFGDINDWPNSPGAKAAQLLQVETPDFSFPSGSKAKATWLGHAGVLVQLPPLDSPNGRPVRVLFDPLFSSRASPSTFFGPVRSYPPPCTIEDLPPIHIVAISHNHFDHMSAEALISLYNQNLKTVRFFVPLGNKHFLVSWGIPSDRIIELDWWDSVQLGTDTLSSSTASLKIHCTPAQHNSFRSSGDTNLALWSSWYIEYLPSDPHSIHGPKPYRVFFGGDTGYQFHPSPAWPPSPANPHPDIPAEDETTYPPCPAFAEIRDRIGPPDLLLLPVSVGATFSYLRSFVPLPNWVNPFPRHTAGVTGANHMPAWDAVKVMKEMVGVGELGMGEESGSSGGTGGPAETEKEAVAMAVHWGTFVPDPEEVLHTLGSLEWACQQQGVKFVRELREEGADREEERRGLRFAAVNHGGSVCI